MPNDDHPLQADPNQILLAIEWPSQLANQLFNIPRLKQFIKEDPSLLPTEEEKNPKGSTLEGCVNLFTQAEILSAENKW